MGAKTATATKKKKATPAKRLVIPRDGKLQWTGSSDMLPNPRLAKLQKYSGKTLKSYVAANGDRATLRNAIHGGLVRVV